MRTRRSTAGRPERCRGQHAEAVQLLEQCDRSAHRPLDLAGRAGCSSVVELQYEGLWPTRWAGRLDVLDEPVQGIQSPETFLVTLNDRWRVGGDRVVTVMHYEHPIYTPDAVRAQSRLSDLATDRTA